MASKSETDAIIDTARAAFDAAVEAGIAAATPELLRRGKTPEEIATAASGFRLAALIHRDKAMAALRASLPATANEKRQ